MSHREDVKMGPEPVAPQGSAGGRRVSQGAERGAGTPRLNISVPRGWWGPRNRHGETRAAVTRADPTGKAQRAETCGCFSCLRWPRRGDRPAATHLSGKTRPVFKGLFGLSYDWALTKVKN